MNGTSTGPVKCAIWARVSTTDQHTENQLYVLREWAERRGYEVVREFIVEDSAWAVAQPMPSAAPVTIATNKLAWFMVPAGCSTCLQAVHASRQRVMDSGSPLRHVPQRFVPKTGHFMRALGGVFPRSGRAVGGS